MTTEHDTGKCVPAAINSLLPIRRDVCSSGYLCLDSKEDILSYNGLVAAFNIVLRQVSLIRCSLLIQDAHRVSLLQKRITDVLLVGKYLLDVALVPFVMLGAVLYAIRFQATLDLQEASSLKV